MRTLPDNRLGIEYAIWPPKPLLLFLHSYLKVETVDRGHYCRYWEYNRSRVSVDIGILSVLSTSAATRLVFVLRHSAAPKARDQHTVQPHI